MIHTTIFKLSWTGYRKYSLNSDICRWITESVQSRIQVFAIMCHLGFVYRALGLASVDMREVSAVFNRRGDTLYHMRPPHLVNLWLSGISATDWQAARLWRRSGSLSQQFPAALSDLKSLNVCLPFWPSSHHSPGISLLFPEENTLSFISEGDSVLWILPFWFAQSCHVCADVQE